MGVSILQFTTITPAEKSLNVYHSKGLIKILNELLINTIYIWKEHGFSYLWHMKTMKQRCELAFGEYLLSGS